MFRTAGIIPSSLLLQGLSRLQYLRILLSSGYVGKPEWLRKLAVICANYDSGCGLNSQNLHFDPRKSTRYLMMRVSVSGEIGMVVLYM